MHGHGYRFLADVDEPEDHEPGGRPPAAGHIPIGRPRFVEKPSNSFVGRDDDVSAVKSLLADHRLISIVGPPGAGKTRLALEVAVDDNPAHSPVVVRLERAEDAAMAIAAELGVVTDGDAGDADLLTLSAIALGGSTHLLVLDDCDLLINDVGRSVPALLAQAADLRILVTSRTPIGVADEVIHTLHPLDTGTGPESPAAALFTDRVHQIDPDRSFSDDDMAAVDRICQLVDGLPLAIELAAGRIRHLTLAQLEQRVTEQLGVLERPGTDDRHRTLEAAFSWSWDLLAEDEKKLLGRLAAVPDDLDLATAEVIGGANTERLLLRLLDRSLLMMVPGPSGTRRYRLLHVLRDFVLARISSAEVEDARERYFQHLDHWIPVLAAGVRLDDRADTVERAKSWRVPTAGAIHAGIQTNPARAAKLAGALSVLVEQAGVDPSSMAAIVAATDSDAVMEAAQPSHIVQIGHVCSSFDLDVMRRLGDWAEQRSDDPHWALAAANLTGWHRAVLGRTDEALAALDRAVALARELGETWEAASALQGRGVALGADGQAHAAIEGLRRGRRSLCGNRRWDARQQRPVHGGQGGVRQRYRNGGRHPMDRTVCRLCDRDRQRARTGPRPAGSGLPARVRGRGGHHPLRPVRFFGGSAICAV